MTMMNRIFFLIVLCACAFETNAQDPHFSQFFASPLTLNPANTGNFTGRLRAVANFRNQWPTFADAYSTTTVSVDGPVLRKLTPTNDRISVGLMMLSDKSGNGILKENFIALSLSYAKQLDKKGRHTIITGFQGIFSKMNFDETKADFEDELTASGFTLRSSEFFMTKKLGNSSVDMSAGLLYRGSTTDKNLFYVGTSVYHILKPKVGFIDKNYFIEPRINLQAGSYFPIGYFTTLHSSIQFQHQSSYNEIILGSAISYFYSTHPTNYYEFYAGLWLRNKDAIIPYIGIEWNNFRAGFSYDVNYSKTKPLSRLYQSSEFSLLYIIRGEEDVNGAQCAKF